MGYSIDPISADCYEGTDELMIATIQSANGIVDYLRNLFKESII